MVSQAVPVYAALPSALIRFGIQGAVGEDEAYHTTLAGAEVLSDLVSQYPIRKYREDLLVLSTCPVLPANTLIPSSMASSR